MSRVVLHVVPRTAPAPTLEPWATRLGRRIYGEPLTRRGAWTMLRLVRPCPTCGRIVAVPIIQSAYCRCGAELVVMLRARDAAVDEVGAPRWPPIVVLPAVNGEEA